MKTREQGTQTEEDVFMPQYLDDGVQAETKVSDSLKVSARVTSISGATKKRKRLSIRVVVYEGGSPVRKRKKDCRSA